MKTILRTTIALLLAICFAGISNAQHLTIFALNDTHSFVQPADDGQGGAFRHRAIVDSLRHCSPHFVAIHAGDAVQGTNYFSMFGGDVEFALIDSVGFDIAILGNHEFDNGIERLAKYYKAMKVTHLSSNYDFSGTCMEGLFMPYIIKNYGGKRVAFIGLNVQPKGMIADDKIPGVTYYDSQVIGIQLSDYLKETGQADYVVAVTHIGYRGFTPDQECDVYLAQNSTNIDLIVGAHSHTLLNPAKPSSKYPYRIKNKAGRDVVITQAGRGGKNAALVDFNLENGEIDYQVLTIDSKYDALAAKYTDLQAWLKPYDDAVYEKMHKVLCQSSANMPNSGQGALSNWVCDVTRTIVSQLAGVKADCAIMNCGGIRHKLPKGDVSEGLIESIFPFDNRYVLLELTGVELLESLRIMASRGGDAVSAELDVVFADGGELVSAKIGGKDIKPTKKYKVATIDYLANGGDYMTSLRDAKRLYVDDVPYNRHLRKYCIALGEAGKAIESPSNVRMRKKK